jgi:hypothetical protein
VVGIVGWLLGVLGLLRLDPSQADWCLTVHQDAEGRRREFIVCRSGHSILLSRNTRLARYYYASVD